MTTSIVRPLRLAAVLPIVAALAVLASAGAGTAAPPPGPTCAKTASDALRACVAQVGRFQQRCYKTTGAACDASDPRLARLLDRVPARVLARCGAPGTVQAAGYGAALTPAGLVERIQSACTTAVAGLTSRSYGGPHAAARAGAFPTDQKCLDGAWRDAQSFLQQAVQQRSACIRNVALGRPCDVARLDAKLATRRSAAASRIAGRCPTPLDQLVAIDAPTFVERADAQARCLTATAHGDTAPLALDCGPRASVPVPARGVVTQVVLPSAVWGSKCGDGSDYAFRIRLAPPGSPVERVVVHLEGGGVCLNGPDCASKNADLFEAISDGMPSGGILSSSAATNPFRDWTKVYLPYCTQDLHMGGGVTNPYPEITVERHGALNVRATMQYVRDVIWAELDATDPEGYRPDRPLTVFAGTSAGAFGVAYNYHWMLDDLGWAHTTALPDAGLGMDNGVAGVIFLGTLTLPAAHPGWNTKPYLPPYCFAPACGEIFVNLELATAPRLLGVPEQQILNVSNQIDTTQRNTTLFGSHPAFVNTLRANYCEAQGTPGVKSFLRGSSSSIHGMVHNGNWDSAVVDGVALRDWVGGAMSSPAAVVDAVEEGTLQVDYPGVQPFPCAID